MKAGEEYHVLDVADAWIEGGKVDGETGRVRDLSVERESRVSENKIPIV